MATALPALLIVFDVVGGVVLIYLVAVILKIALLRTKEPPHA